jgi:hypothetical protein
MHPDPAFGEGHSPVFFDISDASIKVILYVIVDETAL